MLVGRDQEGRLYATHPAIAEPWACPANPSGHALVIPKPRTVNYPEHDNLSEVASQTQAIGEFMEWLEGKGVFLAHYIDGMNFPRQYNTSVRDLLAEWAGIDQNKLEAEKRQILDAIRAHA